MACDCIPDPNNCDQIDESRRDYWDHHHHYDDRRYYPDPRDNYQEEPEYCDDDSAYGYSPMSSVEQYDEQYEVQNDTALEREFDSQLENAQNEQEIHEANERQAEIELESLHNQVQEEKVQELEKELQKQIDEERGHVAFWRTKTEQLECVGTHEKATFMRSLPQQNMKDENGEHTFYDPRNYRSGVAFKDYVRSNDRD